MKIIQYSNKGWELAVAKAFPERCGNEKCMHNISLLKEETHASLGLKVIVRCPKCGWEKDITPYDLW